MKRVLSTGLLLSLVFAVPAFAAQNDQPAGQTQSGQTFEQRQAHILKMIDQRIAGMQEGRACVQAAKTDDDLKVCREKHRAEMKEKHGEMGHHGMEGGHHGGQ